MASAEPALRSSPLVDSRGSRGVVRDQDRVEAFSLCRYVRTASGSGFVADVFACARAWLGASVWVHRDEGMDLGVWTIRYVHSSLADKLGTNCFELEQPTVSATVVSGWWSIRGTG